MTAAEVMLWGTRIGTVAFDDSTRLGSFEYDPAFLSSGIEVSPITMPLSRRVYIFPELAGPSFHGLPGLLANSLPDKFGNAVIDAWLRSQGRDPASFNAVERLYCTGSRGMGALEYVPARGPAAAGPESIEIERLVTLAADILHAREELHVTAGENAMQEIIRVGSSAGGARAKAVIAWNEGTGDIRSGQIEAGSGYGYWLIKFDGVSGNGDKEGEDPPCYTRIEYAYFLMAQAAGIQMSECRLYQEKNRSHFMTRRFDRDPRTGRKLHMQSLGGIAHFDFNQPGAYSYEQAARVMRQLRISGTEISQFYRRMVFNVLARNQDDHVKNISFLMDRRGRWSLAPAYDVTYACNPGGRWTGTHQMCVNGKREQIALPDLLAAGKNMGIKKTEAGRIIDAVRRSLSLWYEFAETAGLREPEAQSIARQFISL
ncbi:type II toxin-antitoxin system HipA family toxin [Lachnoclostridium sp. Marseille-P6806]|uniref:type II toxin-antitoxin system HipA family toxin n=1 Tax=Lachnoclostridium sp. Marseille-P6806 TaxID=2364793 RepID=UPI0010307B6D|nr:type II toxin-antitoxin system HipA family toxin [Lachnoclostridium sp. Marseille-P6806]